MLKKLSECYKNPSQAKREIYNACVAKAISDNAVVYGIKTYNTQMFTFEYTRTDGKTIRIKPSNFFEMCRGFY